jgi:hypothetical protein
MKNHMMMGQMNLHLMQAGQIMLRLDSLQIMQVKMLLDLNGSKLKMVVHST